MDRPAAVRARTILAGSRHAWLQRDASSATAHLVGLVDDDGRPHVVLQPWEDLPPGRARVTCTEVADEIGVLTLGGELGERVAAAEVPGVVAAMHLGRPCAGEGGRCPGCPGPEVSVMPLAVTAVRVAAPGPSPRGSVPGLGVRPEAFGAAEPDRWALLGEGAAGHLEAFHQSDLLRVVRERGLVGVGAVSVRAVDADGLVLTCLARDGVADVVVPFTPRLTDPRGLVDRLG